MRAMSFRVFGLRVASFRALAGTELQQWTRSDAESAIWTRP